MKALLHLRRVLNGFPARIQADNALLTLKSKSLRFLKLNGVEVTHGLAHVSRSQTHAERALGTLTRLLTKFHTAAPSTSLERLVEEATITMNKSPHEGLPPGVSPAEIHFSRAPISFLRTAAEGDVKGPKSVVDAMRAASAATHEALQFSVAAFMRRNKKESPTNYTRRLEVGDFALQKRSIFPSNAPKKLCFKVRVEGYQIVARIATNAFKCRNVITGSVKHLPGDMLIKLRGFDEQQLKQLINSMEIAESRNAASVGRRKTRSSVRNNDSSASTFVEVDLPQTKPPFEALCSVNFMQ